MTAEQEREAIVKKAGSWWPGIITYAALTVISGVFGPMVACWIGSVLLAFCIGVFWGAGDQMRKHEESRAHLTTAGDG